MRPVSMAKMQCNQIKKERNTKTLEKVNGEKRASVHQMTNAQNGNTTDYKRV